MACVVSNGQSLFVTQIIQVPSQRFLFRDKAARARFECLLAAVCRMTLLVFSDAENSRDCRESKPEMFHM